MTVAGIPPTRQIRGCMPRFPTPLRGLVLVAALAAAWAVPRPATAQNTSKDDGGGLVGLALPVGARAVGQGRAISAASGELQALPYNPATLTGLDRGAVTFSRYESASDAGINSNFVAAGWTSPWGAFAVQALYDDFGDVVVTTDSPDPAGHLSVSEWAVGVSWANRWRETLSYGGTARIYRSDLGETTATGPVFDLGVQYAPRGDLPLDFAVSLRNLGPSLSYDPVDGQAGADQRLPGRVRLGVGFHPESFGGMSKEYAVALYFDTESDLKQLSTTSVHAGGSVTLHDLLVVRAGLMVSDNPYVNQGDGAKQTGGSFGIGIRYEGFEADVAREISVSELGDETHFAVGWRF